MRIAVLDLGTNTFHLVIANLFKDHYGVIYRDREDVLIEIQEPPANRISAAAEARILHTLKRYGAVIKQYRADRTIAVATSAFRTADNGMTLAKKIKKETALPVRILSGDAEADLIHWGVKTIVGARRGCYLVVDIGGGSVELIAVRGRVRVKKSLEMGAQRLLRAFHTEDPISTTSRKKFFAYAEENIRPFLDGLPFAVDTLVGTSGTFNTLYKIHALQRQIKKSFTGLEEIPVAALQALTDQIISLPRGARLKMEGMPANRADMIVVGSLVVQYVVKACQVREVFISSFSLREGVIHREMEKEKKKAGR